MKYAHTDNSSFLQHYGIQGQKWGVRRFQNEDGSYTEAGKSRYQRGQDYNRELKKHYFAEYDRIINNSKEIKKAEEESDSLIKKYSMNPETKQRTKDSRNKWSNEELIKVEERLEELQNKIDRVYDRANKNATNKSRLKIMKKYGETALSDIDYYNKIDTVKGAAVAAAVLAVASTPIILISKLLHKNKSK